MLTQRASGKGGQNVYGFGVPLDGSAAPQKLNGAL
jgi:hypothetical protein